jgi:hypothetical protein
MNSGGDNRLAETAAALRLQIERSRQSLAESTRRLQAGIDALEKGRQRFVGQFDTALDGQRKRLNAVRLEIDAHARSREVLNGRARRFEARLQLVLFLLRLKLFWYRHRMVLITLIIIAVLAAIIVFLGPHLLAAWMRSNTWLDSLRPAVQPLPASAAPP